MRRAARVRARPVPFVAVTVLPRRSSAAFRAKRSAARQVARAFRGINGPFPRLLRCAAQPRAPSTYSTLPLAPVRRRGAVGFARRPTNAGQEPAVIRLAPRVQQPRAAPSELRPGGWTERQGCESSFDQVARHENGMRVPLRIDALLACCRGLACRRSALRPDDTTVLVSSKD